MCLLFPLPPFWDAVSIHLSLYPLILHPEITNIVRFAVAVNVNDIYWDSDGSLWSEWQYQEIFFTLLLLNQQTLSHSPLDS